jgi:hypothetical protein
MDAMFLYSENQAETTVAAHDSTNTYDHGSQALPINQPLWLEFTITTTVTSGGAATLQVKYFNDAVELYDSGAIALATLVAGYKIQIPISSALVDGVTKLEYTIGTAVLTAGAWSAALKTNVALNNT